MAHGAHHNPDRNTVQSGSLRLRRFPDDITVAQDHILALAAEQGYPDASTFALRLVLEESISNAFRHGNKMREGAHVDVEWAIGPDQAVLSVEDQGEGFDPESLPDPTDEDRLELPSGRGVLLIRAYMSEVEYNDRGNRLTMTYRRPN